MGRWPSASAAAISASSGSMPPAASPSCACSPPRWARTTRRGSNGGSGCYLDGRYLYVFGSYRPPDPYVWGHAQWLARVPIANLGSVGAWRYWTGSIWSAAATDALPVIGTDLTVEGTIGVVKDPASGLFSVVFKEGSYLGTRIMRISAPALTGPWIVDPVPIAVPDKLNDTDYTYGAVSIPLAGAARGIIVSHGNATPGTPLDQLGIFPVQ